MANGNKGFAQGLAVGVAPSATRLPPRTGVLQQRSNRLADLASGHLVTREHELVDPATCRVWSFHNRDYAALDPENCADLIESFRAQGRQEVPAIVRRLVGEGDYAFEIICGARRHWTATYLRAHGLPQFRFLVEPRELTDEEAFRLADLENRSRRDLSDIERARDYAGALDRYYDGNQGRMAERLEVSQSWLSRYLDLAKLPDAVVAAFGAPQQVKISHGAVLSPLLRQPLLRQGLMLEAEILASEQSARAGQGQEAVLPAEVARRLQDAAASRKPGRRAAPPKIEHTVLAPGGRAMAQGFLDKKGDVTMTFRAGFLAERRTLFDAMNEIINAVTAPGKEG